MSPLMLAFEISGVKSKRWGLYLNAMSDFDLKWWDRDVWMWMLLMINVILNLIFRTSQSCNTFQLGVNVDFPFSNNRLHYKCRGRCAIFLVELESIHLFCTLLILHRVWSLSQGTQSTRWGTPLQDVNPSHNTIAHTHKRIHTL